MIASASITLTKISDGLTTFYEYAQNSSNTTAPVSGWSETVPVAAAGKFIWRREGSALTKAEVTSWKIVCLTGAKGDKGDRGEAGSYPVIQYAIGTWDAPPSTVIIGEESWGLGHDYWIAGQNFWESTVKYTSNPDDYVWMRVAQYNPIEETYSEWSYTRLSGVQGEAGPKGKLGQMGLLADGDTLYLKAFDEEGNLTDESGIVYTSEDMFVVEEYSKKLEANGQGYVVFGEAGVIYAKLRADNNSKRWTQYDEDITISEGQWVIGSFIKSGESIYDMKMIYPQRMVDFEVTHFMDILKSGDIENINVWANANGIDTVFSKLAILNAFIDHLEARRLVVSEANKDFVFSVTPDGHIAEDGRRLPSFDVSVPDPKPGEPYNRKSLLHINAEDKSLKIDTDGSFSGIINSPALTTTRGSEAVNKTYTSEVKSPYKISSLYDGASLVIDGDIETVSASHYGKSIAKAGKLSDSGKMLKLGEWSVENFKQGSGWTNYANTTVPQGCNYINVTLTIYNDFGGTGGSNIEIWRGGTRIYNQTYRGSASSTKSAAYTFSVQPGDILKAYMEGYSLWGSSRGYVDVVFRARASAKSLFFLYEDGLSEFVPYNGHSSIPAKIKSYIQEGEYFLASSLRSKLKDDHPSDTWVSCLSGSSVTFKTYSNSETTKAIRGFKLISNTVQFLEDDGNVFSLSIWDGGLNSTEGLHTSLSTTVITESEPRKVEVATVTPKSGATIGTSSLRFTFGYFVSLIAQAIDLSGPLKAASINTGDGAFKIGQNLRQTDNVQFNEIKQNVAFILGRKWDEGVAYTQEIVNAKAGSVTVYSSDAEASTKSSSYAKVKEITVDITGTVTVTFYLWGNYDTNAYHRGRIYKNGTAVGTERQRGDPGATFSENISVTKGDKVQIYARTYSAGITTYVKEFRIKTSRGFPI